MKIINNQDIRFINELKKCIQTGSKVYLNIEIQKQRNEIENIKNKLSTI